MNIFRAITISNKTVTCFPPLFLYFCTFPATLLTCGNRYLLYHFPLPLAVIIPRKQVSFRRIENVGTQKRSAGRAETFARNDCIHFPLFMLMADAFSGSSAHYAVHVSLHCRLNLSGMGGGSRFHRCRRCRSGEETPGGDPPDAISCPDVAKATWATPAAREKERGSNRCERQKAAFAGYSKCFAVRQETFPPVFLLVKLGIIRVRVLRNVGTVLRQA